MACLSDKGKIKGNTIYYGLEHLTNRIIRFNSKMSTNDGDNPYLIVYDENDMDFYYHIEPYQIFTTREEAEEKLKQQKRGE
ncbi:MAG: hypothetical protein EOL95_09365 [Bacteroidia bacterium]|nr:hypothetical protein [Bacteroidia bacterium]